MAQDTLDLKTMIYARDDVVFVFRRELYAKPHAHHALQLTVAAAKSSFNVILNRETHTTSGILIDQDYLHLVAGQSEWVGTLLINPETAVAHTLRPHYLANHPFFQLDNSTTTKIQSLLFSICRMNVSSAEVNEIWEGITAVLNLNPPPVPAIDPRIQEALKIVEEQEAYKISAQKLADQLALSQSRMAHLFKEDLGIPLRRYLLWHKLLAGLQAASEGQSLTEAAHNAGFTDLAHFSHTCHTMFGFWPSVMFAQQATQNTHVTLCD
jgi:AraC-like DNA-binding protein